MLQINERFSQNTLEILSEIFIFSYENLMKNGTSTRAKKWCQNYKIDVYGVENEYREFKILYKSIEEDIDVSDIVKKKEISTKIESI